jgi:hypothetical protein
MHPYIHDFVTKTNIYKLATKEDASHMHKILGIFALLHFTYRYYLLLTYKSMLLNTIADMYFVALHGILSVSSLIFHIPKKRNPQAPMIYPEFRLHSIAFGMRSVLCCFIDFIGSSYKLQYKMAACIATMMAADYITSKTAQPGDSTMRSMPYDDKITDTDRARINRFYSIQQISATLYMLINRDSAFSPLLAIQIAAFLMTLVRKNIIKPNTWHIVYVWSLLVNILVFHTMTSSQIIYVSIGTIVAEVLRIDWHWNKYLMWCCVFTFFGMLDCKYLDSIVWKPMLEAGVMSVYLLWNIVIISPLYKNNIGETITLHIE